MFPHSKLGKLVCMSLIQLFITAYGLTEAGFVTLNIYNKKQKAASAGVLLPGCEGQVS